MDVHLSLSKVLMSPDGQLSIITLKQADINMFTLHTPIDDTEMPDYVICHACRNLGIPTPDCVSHEEKRYNDIKEKFPGKRNS